MTGPRIGQGMPANDGWIAREFADLRRQLTELRAARTLDASTISPNGTLHVDGTLAVAGNLTVTGTTALGGTVTVDGVLDSDNYVAGATGFNIDGTTGTPEFNDLILRGGIIGNDALSSPVVPAIVNATDFNNTFTGTMTAYLTHAVTVPTGFTQALVTTSATVVATTGSFVALNVKTTIDGADSDIVETSDNLTAVAPVPFSFLATGLSGSFNISVSAQAAGAMTASSGSVYLAATVLFLR